MLKVEKNRHIRSRLVLLTGFVLILLTSLSYFLGWDLNSKTFLIYIIIILIEIFLLLMLHFILKILNKSYFVITKDSISLLNKNQVIFSITSADIIKLYYVGFSWIFLLQMGAGYLHIQHRSNEEIKNQTTYNRGEVKIFSISLSLKEAKNAAEILNKKLIKTF